MRKRVAAGALLLAALFVLSAWAAGATLTLNESDPVDTQVAQLQQYLDSLPRAKREAFVATWEKARQEGTMPGLLGASGVTQDTVYITPSGKAYHLTQQCSGLNRAKRIDSVSLDTALSKSRRPCKLCCP